MLLEEIKHDIADYRNINEKDAISFIYYVLLHSETNLNLDPISMAINNKRCIDTMLEMLFLDSQSLQSQNDFMPYFEKHI